MNLNHVYQNSYLVRAPSLWQGLYVFSQGEDGKSWSWYLNGKPGKNKEVETWEYKYRDGTVEAREYPHFTISTDKAETGPGNSWKGFHVTFPLASGKSGYNAHFRYQVANGVARFAFTDGDVPPSFIAMVDELDKRLARLINIFAQSFVSAAWR